MFPLGDSEPHGPAPVTRLLVAANVLVFLWQALGGPAHLAWSVEAFGFVPVKFFQDPLGEFPRILTAMFLHGGVAHLVGNMWFLWIFGPGVEDRLGPGRYLFLYFAAGVGAALFQAAAMPTSPVPMVGASGAISGVLGAYFVLLPHAQVLTLVWFFVPFFFWLPAATYAAYWLLVQFVYGLMGVPGVAWWAHVGDFLVGAALAPLLAERRRYRAAPAWFAYAQVPVKLRERR